MAVLSQFPLRLLIHTTAIEMLLTILSCYAMAVHDGHVKPWLPTISECGVFPPEKYFFRYGFVIGACLMAAQGVATYNALKSWAKSRTYLFLIAVASFCLGLVGVVSMREDSSVHNVTAVIFFLCSDVNMVLTTWYFSDRLTASSLAIKTLLTLIGSTVFFVFYYQEFFRPLLGLGASVYLAIFEWTNVLTIIFYYWSFAMDMHTLFIALTDAEAASPPRYKKDATHN